MPACSSSTRAIVIQYIWDSQRSMEMGNCAANRSNNSLFKLHIIRPRDIILCSGKAFYQTSRHLSTNMPSTYYSTEVDNYAHIELYKPQLFPNLKLMIDLFKGSEIDKTELSLASRFAHPEAIKNAYGDEP